MAETAKTAAAPAPAPAAGAPAPAPAPAVAKAAPAAPVAKLASLGLPGDGFTQTVAVVVDPAACPDTHVCMHTAGNLRVALTSGRVYIFEAGKPQYVHKEDRDAVAARGAAEYQAQ